MSKLRRSTVILVFAMALAAGAVVLTTHAADQGSPPAGVQPTRTAAASTPVLPHAVTPAATKPGATKPPAPGAPQVPEESATIRDDPTIAPDPKQSADNNVSFPNDI
jgi:ABC-type sugar transport system substrate-binding protein